MAVLAVLAACSGSQPSRAAPYAAHVMDARTGETLYTENADARLHPASLTKMMTLYIAFEEIERGNISLDTMVTVSAHAAAQPPSRLGLKPGQKIALRYLIRAAAIKSANDAATAIGEAISGSEARFAQRMTRTAKALGMKNTTFKNANGLTANGHLSTARDMSTLGRRLFYDFPQYYNIFSRRSTDAGMAEVANTNRRFLDAYPGADGIKTGYTVAAGFNLTASAERGGKRIIATVFGGKSTAHRNQKVAELLDIGFGKAPARANEVVPAAPDYTDQEEPAIAANDGLPEVEGGAGKTIRVKMAVARSPRPKARPGAEATAVALAEAALPEEKVAAIEAGIEGALAEALAPAPEPGTLDHQAAALAADAAAAAPEAPAEVATDLAQTAVAATEAEVPDPATEPLTALASLAPPARPGQPDGGAADLGEAEEAPVLLAEAAAAPVMTDPAAGELALAEAVTDEDVDLSAIEPVQLAAVVAPQPARRNAPIFEKKTARPEPRPEEPEVVTRVSTSGGRHWGVNLGRFNTRGEAEKVLLRMQLNESVVLGGGLRKIIQKGGGFDANFMGLTQDQADLACRRVQARGAQCFTMAP